MLVYARRPRRVPVHSWLPHDFAAHLRPGPAPIRARAGRALRGRSGARSRGASMSGKPEAHVVILAGGRGTRFWPRSRTRTPKQLLNIVGRETMLEQTFDRLWTLIPH